MTVDKSWLMIDTYTGSLVLQRLGFFGDNILKRTTNSGEIWRNILHSDKMMDGEILMVLLECTIHGNPSREALGLPKAQDTSWLVDRSFWQSWAQITNLKLCPWRQERNGFVLTESQPGAQKFIIPACVNCWILVSPHVRRRGKSQQDKMPY